MLERADNREESGNRANDSRQWGDRMMQSRILMGFCASMPIIAAVYIIAQIVRWAIGF